MSKKFNLYTWCVFFFNQKKMRLYISLVQRDEKRAIFLLQLESELGFMYALAMMTENRILG